MPVRDNDIRKKFGLPPDTLYVQNAKNSVYFLDRKGVMFKASRSLISKVKYEAVSQEEYLKYSPALYQLNQERKKTEAHLEKQNSRAPVQEFLNPRPTVTGEIRNSPQVTKENSSVPAQEPLNPRLTVTGEIKNSPQATKIENSSAPAQAHLRTTVSGEIQSSPPVTLNPRLTVTGEIQSSPPVTEIEQGEAHQDLRAKIVAERLAAVGFTKPHSAPAPIMKRIYRPVTSENAPPGNADQDIQSSKPGPKK